MSEDRPAGHGAVHWLTGQAFLFGVMAALLGIAANAMFLEAYGSGWLPVTYILIGVAGVAVSGTIARSAQRFDLVRIALVVLGSAAVLFGLAWGIATDGNAPWVSAPLLVLFPVLIQLGFVFIGGQAGRILDIAGIKASFGRIMTGFPAGAVVGGLVAGPLVGLLGNTEGLLLATAVAQAGFTALVWATGRRYASLLAGTGGPPDADSPDDAGERDRSSLRRLLGRRFVALILAYQVLSALGSQVSDFLVFDRATAQFPDAEDLARFFAGYTAVMNIVSIAFLFLLAGPLLRRYGLRLGIAANPLVITVLAGLMIVVLAAAGGTSVMLLAVVSATRIADIALTDGTTRTSINAMYQVLPTQARLPVQASVEGMGVPLAIAASGVLILVLNALPVPLPAMIAVLAVVCAVWTWTAILLYRSYGPALVDALGQRQLLDPDAALEATIEDASVARRLLVSGDARSARLGLELASTLDAPVLQPELAVLAEDPRPGVRLAARAGLAAAGDDASLRRLGVEVRAAAASPDPATRLHAAVVMGVLDQDDRGAVAGLLRDESTRVRAAALDSVQAGDAFAVAPAVHALEDPASAPSAMAAIGRLGDAALPSLAALLEGEGAPPATVTARMVRAVTTRSVARDAVLLRHVGTRDRELGLRIMERIAGPEPAAGIAAETLDAVLQEDTAHAVRILRVIVALEPGPAAPAAPDVPAAPEAPLRRALEDELALVRDRVIAGRMARHGRDRLGPALARVVAGEPGAALAVEALEVVVGTVAARGVIPLLAPDLSPARRLERLVAGSGAEARRPSPPARGPMEAPVGGDAERWLRDLVEDPDDRWRSAWLRACAIRAAGRRGLLGQFDLAAARVLGDPVVDEELASAGRAGDRDEAPPQ